MWLSVVRSIVRGVLLASGHSKRQVVSATLREGIERLQEVAGPKTPTVATLHVALGALCQSLGVKVPEEIEPPGTD